MNIILDNIIFSLQKSGGISVYWHELISRMLHKNDVDVRFIEKTEISSNIFRKELKIPEDSKLDVASNKIKVLDRYSKIHLKLVGEKFIYHSTYYRTLSKKTKKNNEVKEIVTVHDFTYELFGKGLKKGVHSWQKKKAIKNADVVICISENTKKDLLHFFPECANKDIKVIYNGVSNDYYKLPVTNITNEETPYFLFVGSRTSYKNFDFAVKAVSQLQGFVLKIVGSKLNEKELILLNKCLENRWELLKEVNNSKLNEIYNNAFALLYPSSYEGFGIPVLEAMKAGCPFIAFNSSSLPEVAGNAGVLLDNLSIEEFNMAAAKISENREKIVELGLLQAANFSWDKCYEETLKIYKEILI